MRALIPIAGVFILVHYFPMATVAVRVVVVVVVALTAYFAVGCWLFPLWWSGFLAVFFNEGIFSKKGREYVADGLDNLLRLPYYGGIIAVAALACLALILAAFFNFYPFRFVDRFAGSILVSCLVVLAILSLLVLGSSLPRWLRISLSAVVVGIPLLVALYELPKLQIAQLGGLRPQERFEYENEARKTLAQIIAGGALLLGLYFTWRQLTITQEGQITDRFTKAMAQLGDEKLALRLGGIYALDRIAHDSPRDHGPIIEVLTAYVRERKRGNETEVTEIQEAAPNGRPTVPVGIAHPRLTILDAGRWETWQAHLGPNRLAPDIQAILTILADFSRRDQLFWRQADLSGACLRGLHLHGLSNLRSALLSGADLSDSFLSSVDLSFAELSHSNLSGSWLRSTNLSYASLLDANLRGAHLISAGLNNARLDGADLNGADLTSANLTHANLEGADLTGVRGLTSEQIRSARID